MSWLTIGLVALVIGIGAGLLVLWWRLPKWQMERLGLDNPKERADVEDNFRKTISQLLGGAAVLIGAVFAYFQFVQQQQASRDLLVSNQIAKGFEELGGDKAVVRLGGIYALEGVMNASEQYYQPALEALCAFVRDNTRLDNTTTKTEIDRPPPVIEIQAALTVIGRRAAGTGKPNLADARIPNARLVSADLRDADVSGTNLRNADLRRVKLSGAALTRADLSGADLTGANLVGADLSGTKLSGADLSGADLSGVHGAADLDNAHLKGAHLSGADLGSSNLSGADLSGADLSGADLTETLLRSAHLKGANLINVNLSRADLTRAGIRSTSGADLTGANLSGADLRSANLTGARYDKDTRFPNGFNPGERGMDRVD